MKNYFKIEEGDALTSVESNITTQIATLKQQL